MSSAFVLGIRQGVEALRQGGVIAYPTEGVWGLGCDPADYPALQRILDLKQRPVAKGVILLGSRLEQLAPWLGSLSRDEWNRLAQSRGKGVSWLVPHEGNTPWWITGDQPNVAVRLTDHPVVCDLCDGFGGAIVSTSANPGGMAPALNALRVRSYFGNLIEVIVPGALGGQNGPSEIRTLRGDAVIRPGK